MVVILNLYHLHFFLIMDKYRDSILNETVQSGIATKFISEETFINPVNLKFMTSMWTETPISYYIKDLVENRVNNYVDKRCEFFSNNAKLESAYISIEYMRNNNKITDKFLKCLYDKALSIDCYEKHKSKVYDDRCDRDTLGIFKYFLSLAYNAMIDYNQNIKEESRYLSTRINAEYYFINSNYGNDIITDYMYFKGEILQKIIKRTFNNFLTLTSSIKSPENLKGMELIKDLNIFLQDSTIIDWLQYSFRKMGEDSSSATNTIAYIDGIGVDFVMKIMNTKDNSEYIPIDLKFREFVHEFVASSIINDMRIIHKIPNYIITFGGFFCNTSDISKKLCDSGPGRDYSYLLLENVKNSRTLGKRMRLPTIQYREETNDIVDMIFQTFIGLSFGQIHKKFTHYDLHINNIMEYDFINSTHFFDMFKRYTMSYDHYSNPIISKVLFNYYYTKTDFVTVPVKYLYLLIDYGNSYIDGMSKEYIFQSEGRIERLGMTNDRPN